MLTDESAFVAFVIALGNDFPSVIDNPTITFDALVSYQFTIWPIASATIATVPIPDCVMRNLLRITFVLIHDLTLSIAITISDNPKCRRAE